MSHRSAILLTGASGTLGFNVAEMLRLDTTKRVILPLRDPSAVTFTHGADTENVERVHCDLSKPGIAAELVSRYRPSAIVHCAAIGLRPPAPEWADLIHFNVDLTLQLFLASTALPHCQFIHISSGLVYREKARPLNEEDDLRTDHPYGATKASADFLLRSAATDCRRPLTILRPFSFTGPRDAPNRLFPALLSAAADKRTFLMSPGDQIRDYCAVSDIAKGVVAALNAASENERRQHVDIINLGSGNATTLRSLVEQVCRELCLDVDVAYGARDYHPNEPQYLVANIGKAERLLGWKPKTLLLDAVAQLAKESFPDVVSAGKYQHAV